MLPKNNRASTGEIDTIFKKGFSLNSTHLNFRYFKNDNKKTKISFIAPKNVAKLAVKRNLLKRRGYLALEAYNKDLPSGITGAFIFKKYQDDILILKNEVKDLLNKIN